MSADYDIEARDLIARLERRMRELESRMDAAERMGRNALDDARRLEDRMRYLEDER